LSERGSILALPVGEQQALEDVVSNPVSFPSQRNLLGTLTDIPMQGMKILVGSSPKQSSILCFTWRGRKRSRRQRLHVSASSLDRSLAACCHHLSGAHSLLLTLGICCPVVLLERAVESIPTMSITFPLDE